MRRLTFAIDIDGTITENGGGRIHLGAIASLRYLAGAGHNVVYVSGRSSVEGFMLAVYGGTTKIAVGENGGCITTSPQNHTLLASKDRCVEALDAIRGEFEGVKEKAVFPRLTEVVLERTFEIGPVQRFLDEHNMGVRISDSGYAFHINPSDINKGVGFEKAMEMLGVLREDTIAIGDSETDVPLFGAVNTSVALGNSPDGVKSHATMVMDPASGDGLVEAVDVLCSEPGRMRR